MSSRQNPSNYFYKRKRPKGTTQNCCENHHGETYRNHRKDKAPEEKLTKN